ncbi:fhl1, partial [Symbiodinium microadriaticum]
MIATTVALANSLGLDDPVGLPGCPGEVDIHLGDDPSVARSHARIAYNSSKRCFEIRCLHPSGIFVGGVKFLPESEAIPLTNWTVIQIGYRIFYFLLPEKSRQ